MAEVIFFGEKLAEITDLNLRTVINGRSCYQSFGFKLATMSCLKNDSGGAATVYTLFVGAFLSVEFGKSFADVLFKESVMIIHIWMHWFWITTVYFKGFLIFTGQTISLSCISHPRVAEAGLLENVTTPLPPFTPDSYNGTISSQFGNVSRSTSPTVVEEGDRPPETTPNLSSSPCPQEENSTEDSTTSKSEDVPFDSTSDTEDVYTGGTLDVFQYPLKKFTKYSHLKYGKTRGKGKTDEPEGEENRVESVKLVEEKLDINVSMSEDRQEMDRSNGSSVEEVTLTEVPDWATTKFVSDNATDGNETVENVAASKDGSGGATQEEEKEVEVLNNETLVIENKVEESAPYTTVEPFVVKNRVAAATSAQNYEVGQSDLNAGSITGITLGILVVFSLFGAVSFVMYRRRYLNKPQVLHDKCSNLDSSGYIDETSLRENSEEMYSLDNDSFLNSLEAMTIQNYWTENVKHTKL